MTKRFDIGSDNPYKLWTPRSVTKTELDNWPRCTRCSTRCKQSLPIEAYGIYDAGDRWVVIQGTCKGRCENVDGEPTERKETLGGKDNWHDFIKIRWDHYSDAKDDEMLKRDLMKQVSAIHFFDDTILDEAA